MSDKQLPLSHDDVLLTAEAWNGEGRNVALATVVETWGSSPRPTGSQLVIDGEGNFEGSVSGGCVEGAVIGEAIDVIGSGEAKMLEFGVADETAWRVGLSCGGKIRIYVESWARAMQIDALKAVNAARRMRQPIIVVTDTKTGDQRILDKTQFSADPLAAIIAEKLRTGKSAMLDDGRTFMMVHVPPPRLVVIGAVHISQALAPMARLAGYDMRVVDPRTAFATPERFPDIVLHAEWPEDVLAREPFDAFTAVAALTHDPKIDDLPLQAALRAGCFYVGALGSRRTHAARLERLRGQGVADDDLALIHAPVGLDIGAQSPAEIAVAILAEVIAALRQRPAEKRAAA